VVDSSYHWWYVCADSLEWNAKKAMKRYDSVVERRIPTREPSLQSDVGVPILSAVFVGIIGGAFLGAVVWMLFDVWVWKLVVVAGLGACLIVYFWRANMAEESTWADESIETPRPELPELPKPPSMPVLLNSYQGRERLAADTKRVNKVEFEWFISECENDTSMRRFEKEISRDQYRRYRQSLMTQGWARWKNPQIPRLGWELTASAREIISHLK